MHAGGAGAPAGDPRQAAIVAWVAGLAGAGPPATRRRRAPASGAAPAPPPTRRSSPAIRRAAGADLHGAPGGPGCPFGFMLNGRFDLDYERRHFSGDPFDDASVNALRSYHHFLFLSRDSAGDPCGLSVEVLTLQFWEATAACRARRAAAG